MIQVMKNTKTSSRMQDGNWKPMAPAMPCKRTTAQTSNRVIDAFKSRKAEAPETRTRFSCIEEAHESTRPGIESVTKRCHEDHIAVKGQNSVLHYNLGHKFSYVPSDENPGCEGSSGQGIEKNETISAWQLDKSQKQNGGY